MKTTIAFLLVAAVFGQSGGDWTTEQDHQNMMQQLGIKALRPGPRGRAAAGAPNAANYDVEKANPFPNLPDALVLKNGKKVGDAKTWWSKRRP